MVAGCQPNYFQSVIEFWCGVYILRYILILSKCNCDGQPPLACTGINKLGAQVCGAGHMHTLL